jgi:nitrate/nitrite transporter NarK
MGAVGLVLTALFLQQGNVTGVVASLALSSLGTMGSIPVLADSQPLPLGHCPGRGLAVINSAANLAGYFSPQLLGLLKSSSGSYAPGLLIIAAVEFCAAILVLLFVKRDSAGSPNSIHDP